MNLSMGSVLDWAKELLKGADSRGGLWRRNSKDIAVTGAQDPVKHGINDLIKNVAADGI